MKKAIFAALALTAGAALAHEGATGIVKERMDAMSAIAKAMKSMGPMMKGAPYDPAVVEAGGEALATHAEAALEMFPEGSDHKPTKALPAVWTEKDRFDALLEDLSKAGAALAVNASDADGFKPRFLAAAKTCKACHSDFRAPD